MSVYSDARYHDEGLADLDHAPEFCARCDRELEYDAQSCHNCDQTFCDRCFGATCDDLYAGWCRGCAG